MGCDMSKLKFTIPNGASLGDTAQALAGLRQLYRSVGRSELGSAPPNWVMTGHHDGSLVVDYVPESDGAEAERIMKRLLSDVSGLREGIRPRSFSDTWSGALKGLQGFGVQFGDSTAQFDAKALGEARSISRIETHYGTVEGTVMRSSLLGSQDDFDLIDRVTDEKIKCFFRREIIDEIRGSLGRRVVVYGLVNERDGKVLHVDAEEVVVQSTPGESVRWGDVLGVLAD